MATAKLLALGPVHQGLGCVRQAGASVPGMPRGVAWQLTERRSGADPVIGAARFVTMNHFAPTRRV